MQEKAFADALHKVALTVIFGQQWFGPLRQKYVTPGIDRNRRGFARDHAVGEFEKSVPTR
jgi:hypothetical protein